MKLPSKKELTTGVQLFIVMYTMVQGFFHSYLWVWSKIGLPVVWWSSIAMMLLALASVYGFNRWVKKSQGV